MPRFRFTDEDYLYPLIQLRDAPDDNGMLLPIIADFSVSVKRLP